MILFFLEIGYPLGQEKGKKKEKVGVL